MTIPLRRPVRGISTLGSYDLVLTLADASGVLHALNDDRDGARAAYAKAAGHTTSTAQQPYLNLRAKRLS